MKGLTPLEMRAVWSRMDTNKDRSISLGEFLEWLKDKEHFEQFKAPAETEFLA